MRCDAYRPASAGIAQLAEHQPSKLRVAGSNPVSRSRMNEMEFVLLRDGEKGETRAAQGATESRSEAYCCTPQRPAAPSLQSRAARTAPPRCDAHRPSQQAHVAQSVERVLGKDEVSGSIPLVGSIRTQG